MTLLKIPIAGFVLVTALAGQSLNSAKLLEPPMDTWSSYNGDYSGRRFSSL